MPAHVRKSLPTILALAALAVPTAPPAAAQDDAGERRSLEELLEEARRERERLQRELLPEVQTVVDALDDLQRRRREQQAAQHITSLVDLGPDAAPLLVQFVDPGETASRAKVYRSECVVRALKRLAAVSATDGLIGIAREGSLIGRLNALEALSAAPDGDRVAPVLAELSEAQPKSGDESEDADNRAVRLAALGALARVGGAAAQRIVTETLAGEDQEAAANALEALTATRQGAAAERVLELARSPRGSGLATQIAAYLDAVPEAMKLDDAVDDVVALLLRDNVSRDGRVALLNVLREGDHRPPAGQKRELSALTEGLDRDTRQAALMYLAASRDRNARRELLEPFDTLIDEKRNLVSAHEGRAQILHDIREYQASIRDWREALKLQNAQGGGRSETPYLGLARSLAALGKYREAADYIQQAPISMSRLHTLAKERVFERMLESRYRDVFHLPDGGDE